MTVAIAAAPIDFDRDTPSRKQFGKLIFRAGLNLYAKSAYFGGFSALAIDAYREADEINKRTDPSELRAWRLDLRPVRSENATGYSVLIGRSF